MRDPADDMRVIVIGSGFGGAVCASRLAAAGFSVTLLERGPWRDTVPVRAAGIAGASPLPASGGIRYLLRRIRPLGGPKNGVPFGKKGFIELHAAGDLTAICTSSVGGGSHIWSALMVKPPPSYWDGVAAAVSASGMDVHYARVFHELGGAAPSRPQDVPNRTSHAWAGKSFLAPVADDAQPAMGLLFPRHARDTQPYRTHDGVSRTPLDYARAEGAFGSPSGAKSTVDALYLLPALGSGRLVVRELCEVTHIRRTADDGYEVSAHDHRGGRASTFSAPVVVLAAGTLNTLRLLFRSRAHGGLGAMPALGKGIGTNGDCLATWRVDDTPRRNPALGTPVHGRIRIRGHEDVGYMVVAGVDAPPLPRWLRHAAAAAASKKFQLIAMGADRADGVASYAGERLRIRYDMGGSPIYGQVFEAFRSLAQASGWRVKFDDGKAFTAHPMGGCRISDDPALGVVDGRGEVHGLPGLYVADASALPKAAGVPPSLTIAAWASHVAQGLCQSRGMRATPSEPS
ncbi:GMC family oxidoreductase [Variovorax sp. J22P271]|uniref:GMC oxidoreductase n=1 Tax=Variovorax davisae TaxID=3053515 RepID=UPI002576E51C|nr:GMC family oxidoreductase [Variovorax sp. J22P271]MDM0032636.1 GMC family oxidoreductase [Variovorax sp. J22P271]